MSCIYNNFEVENILLGLRNARELVFAPGPKTPPLKRMISIEKWYYKVKYFWLMQRQRLFYLLEKGIVNVIEIEILLRFLFTSIYLIHPDGRSAIMKFIRDCVFDVSISHLNPFVL